MPNLGLEIVENAKGNNGNDLVVSLFSSDSLINSNSLDENQLSKSLLEYKNKLLDLTSFIYKSNTEGEIVDILKGVLDIGIPIQQFINEDHHQQMDAFMFGLNNGNIKNLIGESSTIFSDLNTMEVASEDVFLSTLPKDVRNMFYSSQTSVKEIFNAINYEVAKVVSAILEKLFSIIEYEDALQNSITDKMTGIGNKNNFLINLEREFDLASQDPENNPLSLVFLDKDRFKSINDKYGHLTGDLVLKHFAEIANGIVLDCGGSMYRYGGEEFAIIFPNTSNKEAREILELIVWKVGQIDLREKKTGVLYELTVSAGISTFNEKGKFKKSGEQVKSADKRSYIAKRNGRCMIVDEDYEVSIKDEAVEDELILNQTDINTYKVLLSITDKIQRFLATLIIQKTKIDNGESISSLGQIDNSYRQVAYLLSVLFKNNGYGDFNWLEKPLSIFIGNTYNEPGVNGRFSDVSKFLVDKEKMNFINKIISDNPMSEQCKGLKYVIEMIERDYS